MEKLPLQLQNTCILASISFPKKTERECFDFETKYFATSTSLQLDSRHSLIYWWCCWILGNVSSNYGKFTRILLKIFYPGLELVGDEKHPPFECYFTDVIPPNNIWWLSRSSNRMSSFSKQISAVPPLLWSFQSFHWSPLLGSQLRLIPPFVLLKIKWSPLKSSFPTPNVIDNDRSLNRSLSPDIKGKGVGPWDVASRDRKSVV